MIVASLLLIVVAVVLLALGLAGDTNAYLAGSIAASLLAAIALAMGGRRSAAARDAQPGAADDAVEEAAVGVEELLRDEDEAREPALAGARLVPGARAEAVVTDRRRVPTGAAMATAGTSATAGALTATGTPITGDATTGDAITGAATAGVSVVTAAVPPARTPVDGGSASAGGESASAGGESAPVPAADASAAEGVGGFDHHADEAVAEFGTELAIEVDPASADDQSDEAPAEGAAVVDDGESDDEELIEEIPADEPAAAVSSPVESARVARSTATVYVIDGRPRYHLRSCVHLLGRISESLPAHEAVELGFNPCALCDPDARILGQGRRR